jgi:hypothetical protein
MKIISLKMDVLCALPLLPVRQLIKHYSSYINEDSLSNRL